MACLLCCSVKGSFPNANAKYPGTGAAGGMGFAFLTFLHASLESGIKIVLEETRLSDFVKDADIVITGEGRLMARLSWEKRQSVLQRLQKNMESQ